MVINGDNFFLQQCILRAKKRLGPLLKSIYLLVISAVKPVSKKKHTQSHKGLQDVKTLKNIPKISKNIPIRGG